MFDPATWGTVGQWVSGLGTTFAFTATFYVIRRDAKVRRYAQARKIAFYSVDTTPPGEPEVGGNYQCDGIVTNISDEPIYDVYFWDSDTDEIVESAPVLLPNDQPFTCRRQGSSTLTNIIFRFKDNTGREWTRTTYGKLVEIGPDLWFVPRMHVKLQRRVLTWLFKRRARAFNRGVHRRE